MKLMIAVSMGLAVLAASATPGSAQAPGGFPNVVGALRAAPGCLGVETGRTSSGKQVIFAWFEGKQALVDWYHSEAHQRAMRSSPILAIVSVKFDESPKPDTGPRPISSIGIELYGPLPGGVAMGGRFAPVGLEVPGLREFERR